MKKNYDHDLELKKAEEELRKVNGELEEKIGDETEVEKEEFNENEENLAENQVKLTSGEVITFDFESLTGNKIIKIKENYQKRRGKKASAIEELDDLYYLMVAEATSGRAYTDFLAMKYKDFNAVKNCVRTFLQLD